MKAVGIIPARLQSSRLPRKLLLDETGKPLLQHTWEAACGASSLDDVWVATDSEEIAFAVGEFGGQAILTGDHPSGTDRIAEAVRLLELPHEIVINIQGDEPEIDPAHIDELFESLASSEGSSSDCQMATLACPINSIEVLNDPSCCKVVVSQDGRALYFSRSPIPFSRDTPADQIMNNQQDTSPWRLHIGMYAFQRDFLQQLTKLPRSPLEELEKLEQLRALEAGAGIRVVDVASCTVGIDTPDDYARFVERFRAA